MINLKDLAGLSEPLTKMIEVIAQGIGAVSRPYLIKKTAEAKAYELSIIAKKISEHQGSLKKIEYNDSKLSIISLDKNMISEELDIGERSNLRLGFLEHKRQKNIENITQIAVEQIESEKYVSKQELDEDWITRFFNYAKDISNDEMQLLWSRILAGEVKQPSSFSFRTLETLRNLTKEEAQIFSKVANFTVEGDQINFIPTGRNNNILSDSRISFNEISLMQELGLLLPSETKAFYFPANNNSVDIKDVLLFGNNLLALHRKANSSTIKIPCLLFSEVGKEMLKLIDINPKREFVTSVAKELKNAETEVRIQWTNKSIEII